MGQEIVYCATCQTQLRGADFEKKSAFRVEGQAYCARCARAAVKALPPEKLQALSNRLPPTEETPSRRRGGTSRIMLALDPVRPTQRYVARKNGSAVAAWSIAGGVGVLGILVLLALAAGSGPAPSHPAPVPAAGNAPSPPGPAGREERPPERPARSAADSAGDALRRAREFQRIHPRNLGGQIALYERAAAEAKGTEHAEAAQRELAEVRRKDAEEAAAERAALEDDVRKALEQEEFSRALELLERGRSRRTGPEWADSVGRRIREVTAELDARYARIKSEAVESMRAAKPEGARAAQERVARWGIARLREDLARALEPPKPPPKPAPPGEKAYRQAWEAALAHAAARDYAAAAAAVERAKAEAQSPSVRAEAEGDLEDLRAAGTTLQEALQALGKATKGQAIAVDAGDPAGRRRRVEGTVVRAEPGRLEVRVGESTVSIDLGEVTAASLADLARRKPGADPRAGALLCLVERDAEGALGLLAGSPSSIPEKYWVHARTAASPAPREAQARALFYAAEQEIEGFQTAADAVRKLDVLLKDFGDTAFVRRNRALIAFRAQGGREFFFFAEDLRGGGSFRLARGPKGESFWSSGLDSAEARTRENYVEIAFSALAEVAYRCWVHVGGCCGETLAFSYQASGQQAVLEGGKEPVGIEPGGEAWAPVKQTLSAPSRSHAAHGGPKQPHRWGWVQVPLGRFAEPGLQRIRILTNQQGFSVEHALVTAVRHAPPLETEVRELDKARGAAASRPAPLDPGLVAHWTFDEGAGTTATDSTANQFKAALQGGAGWSPAAAPTRFPNGAALKLDGKKAYVALPGNLAILQEVRECTLAAWIRPESFAPGKEETILLGISKNSPGGPTKDSRACLVLLEGGKVRAGGRSSDSEAYQHATTAERVVSKQAWWHLAAVINYGAGTITVYVNGVAQSLTGGPKFTDRATPKTPSTNGAVGSDDDGSRRYFDGLIDDVRIYSCALSPAEVAALASGHSSRFRR